MTALAAHYTPEHQMFRDTCRRFFEKEVTPFHMKWEEEGIVPRELWRKAGAQGLLGMTMPEEYGGAGADFLYSAILIEEQGRALASGPAFSLHTDIVAPYMLHYGTEEQKQNWLPKAWPRGELVTRHRHDRARHRLGPAGGQDHRGDGRQRLRASTARRPSSPTASSPTWSSSSPRPIPSRRQGHVADRWSRPTRRGLQARPQPREDRHEGAGHLRAVLRRRARAGRPTCWAAATGMGFIQLMQQLPQERLHDRHPARSPPSRRRWSRPSPTSRSARRSASRSSISRTPASSWPSCKTKAHGRRACSSTTAWRGT